jgi:outer membrane protein assembly factor BamB
MTASRAQASSVKHLLPFSAFDVMNPDESRFIQSENTLAMKSKFTVTLATFALLPLANLISADWPQWRGLNRDDVSTETGLAKEWPPEGPKLVWMSKDAGLGYSGYAIVGDTLYTMGAQDAVEYVIAINVKTGKEKWSAEAGPLLTNGWGDGPRSTPTVSGDKVYALSGKGHLVAFNAADGKQIWKVTMEELGGKVPGWGYTESVLVDGDLVICTPGGAQGALAAFDKNTGKKVWQNPEWSDPAQYSSVIAADHNGARQLIQLTAQNVGAVNAKDGAILWKVPFPGKTAVIPTPIFHKGHVFVAAGYGVGAKLIKVGEGNKAEDLNPEMNTAMINHHGGVVLVGEHLYGYSDKGGWTCLDFKTGEVKWQENAKFKKGAIHYADGKLYLIEENSGTVALIDASPEGYKEHGRFTLSPQTTQRNPKGKVWTHPVVCKGKLYLRDQELLYCFDVSGK